jgi:hypothetical protein
MNTTVDLRFDLGHWIAMMVLTIATTGLLLYFVVFLLVTWADRPIVRRDDDGRLRVYRDVREYDPHENGPPDHWHLRAVK